MSRVKGEQLSQALFTAIPLTQPQEAERPDQQAVLAVFVLIIDAMVSVVERRLLAWSPQAAQK